MRTVLYIALVGVALLPAACAKQPAPPVRPAMLHLTAQPLTDGPDQRARLRITRTERSAAPSHLDIVVPVGRPFAVTVPYGSATLGILGELTRDADGSFRLRVDYSERWPGNSIGVRTVRVAVADEPQELMRCFDDRGDTFVLVAHVSAE